MAANAIVQNATQEGQTTEGRLRDLLTGLRSVVRPDPGSRLSGLLHRRRHVTDGRDGLARRRRTDDDLRSRGGRRCLRAPPRARRRCVGCRPSRANPGHGEPCGREQEGTFLSLTGNGEQVLRHALLASCPGVLAWRRVRPWRQRRPPSWAPCRRQSRRFHRAGAAFVCQRRRGGRVRSYAASGCGGGAAGADLAVGLPVRAVAVPFRDANRSKVQLLVHAEVGAGVCRGAEHRHRVHRDGQGRARGRWAAGCDQSRSSGARSSIVPRVPKLAPTSVPASTTIRIAAADGDRVGGVEWTVPAGLLDLDGASWSWPGWSVDRCCRSISLIPRWPVR